MNHRIVGFDLARAYAILGMFIVNFNTVFGSHTVHTGLGGFLNLFNGNSSTTFVILAGMGVSLMTNRPTYELAEQKALRQKVTRRSWFLFVLGLLLYTWWPADILHFYGGYMHIAALLLFVPKRTYGWVAAASVVVFHGLWEVIPFDNGWNFNTLTYTDFWTVRGFLRNTFYNGWNPIFPWLAFFMLGMWLGRLNWQQRAVRLWVLGVGIVVFGLVEILQFAATPGVFGPDLTFYITADYLPPFLPFMLSTASFALILMVVCFAIGNRFGSHRIVQMLTATGQMTLTHYVVHLTLGMLLFGWLTGHSYEGVVNRQTPESPVVVLLFALVFYAFSLGFSVLWKQRFRNGPLELLMRTVAG
jgi:uncharacterized protein